MATHSDLPTTDEPSPLWILAFGGLALLVLGGFVIYETLAIFSSGSAAWMECMRADGIALSGCGDQLNLAFEYRFGLDGLRSLGAGLLAVAVGPVPMIVLLRRYDNNYVGILLFLLIMFPYGLLFFLLLVIGTFVIIFYGIEMT